MRYCFDENPDKERKSLSAEITRIRSEIESIKISKENNNKIYLLPK